MTRHASKDVCANNSAATFFDDLHKPLNGQMAVAEADHCLYCYDAPCIVACPTSIDIPTFIHQIRTGNISGAAHTILSENIMGGTCARACPTEVLCEQACVHTGGEGKAVEIGLLQRYATDHLMAQDGPHPFTRAADSGRHIAVIGAGPAGLSFAHRAAMLGHRVSVYEAKSKPGGLNEYGLAAYKMVGGFAAQEVAFLLDIGGIEIHYDRPLGATLCLDELQTSHDAVFMGLGLGGANDLGLDGEDSEGILDAIDFIEDVRQTDDLSTIKLGRDIIVIGGGNTAIDAAVQAKKLGAENVTLAYRRGEEQMGATAFEVELARKNGVMVRLWSRPVALQGKGAITAMTFERTEIKDGKLNGTGETYDITCDMVLKAIGQKLKQNDLPGLTIEGGKIKVSDIYQTSIKGVFAGGDCVDSGEDLTVQAVQDGKLAAIAVDVWLQNDKEV